MTITTKYNIGDIVWVGMTRCIDKSVKCPECSYGYIKIKLSTGAESQARCPVCYGRNFKHDYDFCPVVERLTIGSVRYNSAADERERFSYMCIETGVGSGSIWYEEYIFATKENAEQHAQILTNQAKAAKIEEIAQREIADKKEYECTACTVPED